MGDTYIYTVALPGHVKGVTVLKDSDYIVLINEALSEREREKALQHELRHIKKNHLYDDAIGIEDCESEADDAFEN